MRRFHSICPRASPMLSFFLFVSACGRDKPDLTAKQVQMGVAKQDPGQESTLGILGGVAMSTSAPLLQYMRAIRHRHNMSRQLPLRLFVGADRFCSGVSVAPNTILTAAHCVEFANNAGDFVVTGMRAEPTTFPFQVLGRRIFYGKSAASHSIPDFPPTNPNLNRFLAYGTANTSADVQFATTLRNADVGFFYDWGRAPAPVVPICTELPTLGSVVTVTGIKLTRTPPALASLSWAEYKARIIQVSDRATNYFQMTSAAPASWTVADPVFAQVTASTAMEFVTEPMDPVRDCGEKGDSVGGVFLTRPNGSVCLLGLNSTSGSSVTLGGVKQCAPTLHRRVLPQMLDSLPKSAPLLSNFTSVNASTSVTVDFFEADKRAKEFSTQMSLYPANLFIPIP